MKLRAAIFHMMMQYILRAYHWSMELIPVLWPLRDSS